MHISFWTGQDPRVLSRFPARVRSVKPEGRQPAVMSTVPCGLVKASSAITSYRSQSSGAEGVGFRTNQ